MRRVVWAVLFVTLAAAATLSLATLLWMLSSAGVLGEVRLVIEGEPLALPDLHFGHWLTLSGAAMLALLLAVALALLPLLALLALVRWSWRRLAQKIKA